MAKKGRCCHPLRPAADRGAVPHNVVWQIRKARFKSISRALRASSAVVGQAQSRMSACCREPGISDIAGAE